MSREKSLFVCKDRSFHFSHFRASIKSFHNRVEDDRDYDPDYPASEYNTPADECAECQSTSKRVQMDKYCDMDFVYLARVYLLVY